MKCPNCGCEIADESVFCEYCATPIKKEQPTPSTRQRNTFITVWLWIMILFNLYNGFEGLTHSLQRYQGGMSFLFFSTGWLELLVVVGAILLLYWKKSGFWMILSSVILEFVCTMIAVFYFQIPIYMAFIPVTALLIGAAILAGTLKLKRNDKSCWSQLE